MSQNYETFFTEIMADAMSFHAVCLETWPPIFYLNEFSQKTIEAINKFNNN